MFKRLFLWVMLASFCHMGLGQQLSDTSYTFRVINPKNEPGKGSTIFIDGAHHNFHRINGRYQAFAKILRADGYVVKANKKILTKKNLRSCRILVIANALHESNATNWVLPTPSAFTANEIKQVQQWVKNGGSLFLIADHMPFGGAAHDLGAAFGFEWINGFAFNEKRTSPDRFTRTEGNLADNNITNGYGTNEKVDTVLSFTGSAFKIPPGARPILLLDEKISVLTPQEAWVFDEHTPSLEGKGLCQGAYLNYGKGKVVAFGEAAMFTAQNSDGFSFGLNLPEARQNNQLLLNIVHWLDFRDY